jgi:hypothetical protein
MGRGLGFSGLGLVLGVLCFVLGVEVWELLRVHGCSFRV